MVISRKIALRQHKAHGMAGLALMKGGTGVSTTARRRTYFWRGIWQRDRAR